MMLTFEVNVARLRRGLFHISRKCDYAMRVLIELGRGGNRVWLPAAQVGRRAGIPLPFLYKLIGKLAQAGLVETRTGPKGGLRLGGEPRSISLLRVFEAVDGPLAFSDCLLQPGVCARSRRCSGRRAVADLQEGLRRNLDRITLRRLLAVGDGPLPGAKRRRAPERAAK